MLKKHMLVSEVSQQYLKVVWMLQGPSSRKRLLKQFGNVVIQQQRNPNLPFKDCIGLVSLKFILQGFNFVKLILAKSVLECNKPTYV
jgi:hypothetical protein